MADLPRQRRKPAFLASAIFLCTGLSVASLFIAMLREPFAGDLREALGTLMSSYPGACALAFLSPLGLWCASVLVFFKPGIGYRLGGVAASIALPWLVLTEVSAPETSWHYLNGPNQFFAYHSPVAILTILTVALLTMATTLSFSRIFLTRIHFSDRAWPAVAVGIVVAIAWMSHSAMPWMLPGIVDGGGPCDMRILHVAKRGLRFHETTIGVSIIDARVWGRQYDRRLFQYRFQGIDKSGRMPEAIRHRADDLVRSPILRNLRTPPAIALRSWNAEGWYMVTSHAPILAFTSEYGTTPPAEVKELFEQIAKLLAAGDSFAVADVCLGFCYDPIAGLGFWYWNNRCTTVEDGITRCL